MIFRRIKFITCPLILVGLYFMLLFFYVVLQRINYPAELELIEGSSVNHVLHIIQGGALYTKPSFEFTANLYTPLFYYCGVVLSYVVGVGFLGLRIVSVLATVAIFMLIASFVYRESRSGVAAFTAGSLYLASYAASGGWMDLARVDSLFVALLLFAIYWMRYAKDVAGLIFSAILFVLAFYTKQSALIAAVPMMLYPLLFPLKGINRFLLPFTFGTFLIFSLGIVDWITDRWFTYYTIVMPSGHPNNTNNAVEFWRHDLVPVMSVAIFFAVTLIGSLLSKKKSKDVLFFAIFLFAMALTSYLTRINKGGYYNNLMPLYATLTIMFGVFIGRVLTEFGTSRIVLITTVMASFAQFWLLSYDPRSYIPTKEDWVENEHMMRDLSSVNGNIYAMDLGFVGYLTGKNNFAHSTSFEDIRLSRYQYWAEFDLHQYVEQHVANTINAIDRNHVNALVLISERNRMLEERIGDFVLKKNYASRQYEQVWSQSNLWVRSWPTRTMFVRPDTFLYVRDSGRSIKE